MKTIKTILWVIFFAIGFTTIYSTHMRDCLNEASILINVGFLFMSFSLGWTFGERISNIYIK